METEYEDSNTEPETDPDMNTGADMETSGDTAPLDADKVHVAPITYNITPPHPSARSVYNHGPPSPTLAKVGAWVEENPLSTLIVIGAGLLWLYRR